MSNWLKEHPFVIHVIAYTIISISLILILRTNIKQQEDLEFLVKQNVENVTNIEEYIFNQKICGDSTPQFCVQLFQRLSNNITNRQRQLLACSAVNYIEGVKIVEGVNCPKRLTNIND